MYTKQTHLLILRKDVNRLSGYVDAVNNTQSRNFIICVQRQLRISDLTLSSVAVLAFAKCLPDILIRRHENSRWFGDRLIELEALHRRKAKADFRVAFTDNYKSIIDKWKDENMKKLQEAQANWDKNPHSQKVQINNDDKPQTSAMRWHKS